MVPCGFLQINPVRNHTGGPVVLQSDREYPLTDDALIVLAKRRDTHAYEELVRRYQGLAWKTALVILRHPQDAEDVTQTAFVKAWQALDRFRDGAPFTPWLLRIVGNEARNLRLARGRRLGRSQVLDEAMPIISRERPLEELVTVAEQSDELVRRIGQLPRPDQEIIHARYVLELNEGEMAALLDIRRGTVKSRLHRAMARLRESYETDREVAS